MQPMDRPATAPLPPPPEPGEEAALFLDIDGSLVDFALVPEAVVIDPNLPPLLMALRDRMGGALALVSGRPIAQVDALIGERAIPIAGIHGAEIRLPDGSVERLDVDHAKVRELHDYAVVLASGLHGVRIEDKTTAFAFHFRGVPQAEPAARLAAAELLRRAGGGFELQHGDCVIEIKPAACDKGVALERLLGTQPFIGRVPWALGDDYTDEHAFMRANMLGGVSIIVGPRRPTAARYALPDPAAARAWLARTLAQEPVDGGAA